MKELVLTLDEIKIIENEMFNLTKEHPKAHIVFDMLNSVIKITYPLPREYWILNTPPLPKSD